MTKRLVSGLVTLMVGLLAGCTPEELPVNNTLTVNTTPVNGATVTINDVERGTSPLTLTDVDPGLAYVVVTREGYRRNWKSVEVPREGPCDVVVNMVPIVGFVTFESTPSFAEVYLDDGTKLGDTPLIRKAVGIGRRTFEFRKENFESVFVTRTIEENFQYGISADLKPKPGTLHVFTRPLGAHVWINNQPQTDLTPAKFVLPPNNYTITVQAEGRVMTEQTVKLGANEEKRLDIDMPEGDAPFGMILIPAGKFIFGEDNSSPDERPKQEVFQKAFFIDKYEVTNAQVQKVFPDYEFEEGEENLPATNVSFKMAEEYARLVGKRLPTEREWEKAARGTDGRDYPWGNEYDPTKCISGDTKPVKVRPVGSRQAGASPYGILDMAGNVYEWTSDWYAAYPGNNEVEKKYGALFRVLRGGCYKSDSFDVRCARRHKDNENSAKPEYGMRLAKDANLGSP